MDEIIFMEWHFPLFHLNYQRRPCDWKTDD
jgi:hypothetical protein